MKRTVRFAGIVVPAGLGVLILPLLILGCRSVASSQPAVNPVNLVVAADGSGQFKSVQAAIMSVLSGNRTNPVVIHVKPGTYKELIYVQREKRFFSLIGENPATTVITYDLYAGLTNFDGKPIGTFRTPSALVDADDFMAENITFENSAGAVGQALAIRVDGDRALFRNCRFLGWQDTILLNRGRQYFENCYIAGHVDFVFGAAAAWFEKCQIQCLGDGYITAASTPADQPFGFVFSNCKITGDKPETRTFLAGPGGFMPARFSWTPKCPKSSARKAGMIGKSPRRTRPRATPSSTVPAPAAAQSNAWTGQSNCRRPKPQPLRRERSSAARTAGTRRSVNKSKTSCGAHPRSTVDFRPSDSRYC